MAIENWDTEWGDFPSTSKPGVSTDDFTCWSCNAIKTYSELADKYVDSMSDALTGPMQTVFLSFVVLWAVVSGLKIIIGDQSPSVLVKDVFFIILAWGLLKSQGTDLISNIYNTSLTLMGDVATVAFTVGPHAPQIEGEGFMGLMEAGEKGVRKVFVFGFSKFTSGNWYQPSTYFLPVLIILPYFMLVVVFFSKMVVAIFRLMMLGTFSPFLIMCFGFSWGRPMAISGLKTALSTITILFAASAAFGLLLYGVNGLTFDKKMLDDPEFLKGNLLVIIALGWMGVALMTEGVGLANSITGTALSNTAAGILSAGIAGSAAMAARYGRGALGLGNSYASGRESFFGNMSGIKQAGSDAKAIGSRVAGVLRPSVPKPGAS